jgi:hypothetical protein
MMMGFSEVRQTAHVGMDGFLWREDDLVWVYVFFFGGVMFSLEGIMTAQQDQGKSDDQIYKFSFSRSMRRRIEASC